jgi:hypothetical protein
MKTKRVGWAARALGVSLHLMYRQSQQLLRTAPALDPASEQFHRKRPAKRQHDRQPSAMPGTEPWLLLIRLHNTYSAQLPPTQPTSVQARRQSDLQSGCK